MGDMEQPSTIAKPYLSLAWFTRVFLIENLAAVCIRGRWFGVVVGATRGPPAARGVAASVYSLTRSSTKSVLPDSDPMFDEKLELALLRKSMSGGAGLCSPELLSGGHRAVKAGSTDIGVGRRQRR
jgi:hypothetical protein